MAEAGNSMFANDRFDDLRELQLALQQLMNIMHAKNTEIILK